MASGGYPTLPEGWRRWSQQGLGPFVTTEVFETPDGAQRIWESGWHRKHARLEVGDGSGSLNVPGARSELRTRGGAPGRR